MILGAGTIRYQNLSEFHSIDPIVVPSTVFSIQPRVVEYSHSKNPHLSCVCVNEHVHGWGKKSNGKMHELNETLISWALKKI